MARVIFDDLHHNGLPWVVAYMGYVQRFRSRLAATRFCTECGWRYRVD